MRHLLLFTILLVGVVHGDEAARDSGHYAAVRVNPVGLFGTPETSLQFTLRRVRPLPEIQVRVEDNVAKNVPYGTYLLEAGDRSVTIRKTVEISQPEVFVTAGVPLAPLDGEVRGLDGSVVTPPKDGQVVWARLMSLFSDISLETQVRSDGTFSFRGTPGGLYVLVVLSGKEVVWMTQVPIKLGVRKITMDDR